MKLPTLLLLISLLFFSCKEKSKEYQYEAPEGKGIENAEKAGLKIAIQSYTFRQLSLIETIEIANQIGIKYLEVYPEHTIGGVWGEKTFSKDLSDQEIEDIKAYAEQNNIQIVGYGVYKTREEADWKEVFAFAQKLNLSYISCEPEENHLDLIEELAKSYNIDVNIHNSIEPSIYNDPKALLEKIKDRDPRMKVCGDVGNWKLFGFEAYESLETVNDRLGSVHLKDLHPNQFDDDVLFDCILNIGIVDIDEVIMRLRDQKFEGYLAIEFISDKPNPTEEVGTSYFYYDLITNRLFPE